MAKCPCGCGRKVPLLKRGAAITVPRVQESLRLLQQSIPGADADPRFASEVRRNIAEGERILSVLLDHVHGVARPNTHPNLMQVTRRLGAWESALASLAHSETPPQAVPSANQANEEKLAQYMRGELMIDLLVLPLPPEQRELAADMAIRDFLDSSDTFQLNLEQPTGRGSRFLKQRAEGDADPEMMNRFESALAEGATESDFREWHDSHIAKQLLIALMQDYAMMAIAYTIIQQVGDAQRGAVICARRCVRFGQKLPTIESDEEQPLPWELRRRVLAHWYNHERGEAIPDQFRTGAQFYRSLIDRGEL